MRQVKTLLGFKESGMKHQTISSRTVKHWQCNLWKLDLQASDLAKGGLPHVAPSHILKGMELHDLKQQAQGTQQTI